MKILSFFFVFSILLIHFNPTLAQKNPLRDEFLDGEFFLMEEQYSEALQAYMKVYNAGYQDNSNINYRIGVCYLNIAGEKSKSLPYLEKAVQNTSVGWREGNFKESTAPIDSWLFLGNAYRINLDLDKAIETYNKFIELNSKGGKAKDTEFAILQIEASKRAKESIQNPARISKENLGRRFNTNQNDFRPVFSGDGNTIAFMSSQRFYDAVLTARKINNTWTNTVNITPQIESDGDQYISSLSYDGKRMFLSQVSATDGNILESEFVTGRWMKSRSIGNTINTKYFESHASISPDGKTLYFTSNRKESLGGMDIFYSNLNDDGSWGTPVNIGPSINTNQNEECPFICNDGKTLFFSSQGHNSIGGFDIFYSQKQDDGSWSKAIALPYPVNTSDDDLYFFPIDNGAAGYMALINDGGFGSGDIYLIDLYPPIAELVEEKAITEEPDTITMLEERDEPVETVKYSIKPIYFDFDRFSLNTESTDKLNTIAAILKENPEMMLEVIGHTDAVGANQYNQLLSEKRAKAVSDYLISKGVGADKLKNKGLSKSQPAAANRKPDGSDSPDGRRLNRRVEFKVLVSPDNVIILQENEIPEDLRIK
jgi:outer membrane protein OmpA-like peptidoglycan-associated protein/tetratricopeptide (TPR) repeat protein